jgi:hypothetical protein
LSCIQTAHRRGHSSIRFPDLIGATARSSIISRHKSSFSATCLEEWIKDIPRILRETSARDKIDGERQLLLAVAAADVLYRCCKKPTIGIDTLPEFLVAYLALGEGGPEASSGPRPANGPAPQPADSPFLKNLGSHHLSTLLAAEFMQALTAAPDLAYSKAMLLCYYWIIRELYTADAPEWNKEEHVRLPAVGYPRS